MRRFGALKKRRPEGSPRCMGSLALQDLTHVGECSSVTRPFPRRFWFVLDLALRHSRTQLRAGHCGIDLVLRAQFAQGDNVVVLRFGRRFLDHNLLRFFHRCSNSSSPCSIKFSTTSDDVIGKPIGSFIRFDAASIACCRDAPRPMMAPCSRTMYSILVLRYERYWSCGY